VAGVGELQSAWTAKVTKQVTGEQLHSFGQGKPADPNTPLKVPGGTGDALRGAIKGVVLAALVSTATGYVLLQTCVAAVVFLSSPFLPTGGGTSCGRGSDAVGCSLPRIHLLSASKELRALCG